MPPHPDPSAAAAMEEAATRWGDADDKRAYQINQKHNISFALRPPMATSSDEDPVNFTTKKRQFTSTMSTASTAVPSARSSVVRDAGGLSIAAGVVSRTAFFELFCLESVEA